MRKPQARKFLLEEFDGFGPVHHAWIFRQPELHMESADDIEPEGVKRTDPHRSRCIGTLARDALRHLACRLVGKRQQQGAPRIDVFIQKAFDARDQRLRLACAGPGLEQIGFTTVRCRRDLQRIERPLDMRHLCRRRDRRQQ